MIADERHGAGAFAGSAITANILMSLVIDKFGMFGMDVHDLSIGHTLGAAPAPMLKSESHSRRQQCSQSRHGWHRR